MAPRRSAEILNLPAECRKRAESFLEEGDYYGWILQGVETKPIGDLTQCTLDFDQTRIVFLAHKETGPEQTYPLAFRLAR